MQQQAERFGAKTVYAGVEGADLTAQPKLLHTDEGDMEAKTVIIATGAYPRELGLPNESSLRGRGVAYCAACDGMTVSYTHLDVYKRQVKRHSTCLSDSSLLSY